MEMTARRNVVGGHELGAQAEHYMLRFDEPDFHNLLAVARREPRFLRHLGHLRQRSDHHRLGFALGAGISQQAHVPMWGQLIERLYRHYGETIPDRYKEPGHAATMTAQYIFNRFKTSKRQDVTYQLNPAIVNITIENDWYRHIHEAIYRKVPSLEEIAVQHPYLAELAFLVFNASFCLTLNFDDLLDRLTERVIIEGSTRERPNVIWRPPTTDRANSCVIYHVNGYLPRSKGAKRSETVVLTEDSFASLQLSANAQDTEYLMSRVVANTLLVIGASFDDPSLRSLFYAAARRNPAGFNYCLLHDEAVDADNVNSAERRDRRDLNRDMYNIITYFVTKAEIASIIRVLCVNSEDFVQMMRQIADEAGSEGALCHHYVVGSVSSGKSSLIERLRAFRTFEEWPETPLELMFLDPLALSAEETKQVDDWVIRQLARKNELMRSGRYGIYVMDRAPLDMFAFSKQPKDNVAKARALRVIVGEDGLKSGAMIHLSASAEALIERQVRRGRGPEWLEEAAYKAGELAAQGERIREIYGIDKTFDTSLLSANDVARVAAERILFADYVPVNLEERRVDFEKGAWLDNVAHSSNGRSAARSASRAPRRAAFWQRLWQRVRT